MIRNNSIYNEDISTHTSSIKMFKLSVLTLMFHNDKIFSNTL